MRRLLTGALLAAALLPTPAADAVDARADHTARPSLSALSLSEPAIHAVGVTGTGLPRTTTLRLTLDVPALVRIRVKDTDPYGLARAFNRTLPAGPSAVTISARVDGTKLPPGRYVVVVKAHDGDGASRKHTLGLRIVGRHG